MIAVLHFLVDVVFRSHAWVWELGELVTRYLFQTDDSITSLLKMYARRDPEEFQSSECEMFVTLVLATSRSCCDTVASVSVLTRTLRGAREDGVTRHMY